MAFSEKTKNEIRFMSSDVLPVFHAFTTRWGGVSVGDFASLNLGSNRGDDPDAVRENFRRFCQLFDAGRDDCCVTKQVHGNNIKVVTAADRHVCLSKVPYEADGLVTGERRLPIFCFTADCVPALLADRKGHAVAAVHCGWRSSVADILRVAVEKMEQLGAKREDICVAFGPSIGACCFETGDDVTDAIRIYLGGDTSGLWTDTLEGKHLVDLRAANQRRMLQLGIPEQNIDVSEECTMCLPNKYWSHRHTQKKGLQRGNLAAGIML